MGYRFFMAGIHAPHPSFCGCRGSEQGLQQEGDKPRFNFSLFWRLEVQDQGAVEPCTKVTGQKSLELTKPQSVATSLQIYTGQSPDPMLLFSC